ncbi:MAG: cyclic nucleotide-binding domain-containing protein [Verrucomicrobiota bacterium]
MAWFKKKQDEALCETMACLHQVPLFSSLTRKELKRLEPLFHDRRYTANEVVFEQGEEGHGMYVVVEGKVKISTRNGSGDKLLAELGNGQFFGELALLDGAPRTATATAKEACRLIGFFRTEFLELLETNGRAGTKISLELARMSSARLRQTLEGQATNGSA